MDVLLSYTVHPFGLKNRVATHEHGERRIGVISQKESYFLPPDPVLGIKKQKYGSTPGPDQMKMSTLPHTTNFMSEPCHS
jgi:hypothetical protein